MIKKYFNKPIIISIITLLISGFTFLFYYSFLNIKSLTCYKQHGNSIESGFVITQFAYEPGLIHTILMILVLVFVLLIIYILIRFLIKQTIINFSNIMLVLFTFLTIIITVMNIILLINDFNYKNNIQTEDKNIVCPTN